MPVNLDVTDESPNQILHDVVTILSTVLDTGMNLRLPSPDLLYWRNCRDSIGPTVSGSMHASSRATSFLSAADTRCFAR